MKVAYQDCDDATAQAAKWDSGEVPTERERVRQNESVVAIIGTFNSGCAAISIPVLNQAPGGGVLHGLAGEHVRLPDASRCAGNEPEKYYPTGKRNYIRVAPSDAEPGRGAGAAR